MDRRTFRTFGPHLVALALTAFAFAVQPAAAEANQPWTVPEIFGGRSVTGVPPQGISWSPDGKRATWISSNGDLMQIQSPDMQPHVLIPNGKIANLLNAPISERARDHRGRYDEPDYVWQPDSQHILFDTNGELWLYDLSTGNGTQIGSSGMQSGDDPKFSPSGQYVSYLRNHNVYVQAIDGQPQALTNTGTDAVLNGEVDWVYLEELDARSNYFWSPDSKQIAYLQMNETDVPEYPIVDFIPVHARVDEQRYPQPGDPNPGVRVGIVSVDGGPTKWLKIPLSAGNDYIPRFGWVNANVVWVETLSRDQKREDLWFADTRSGAVERVLAQSEPKYFDTTYDLHFVGDNQFLLLSWRSGHTHIYRYTFDAADPLSQEAQLASQVDSGNYEVEAIKAVDPRAGTVWYLTYDGTTGQQQVWAVQLDGTSQHQVTRAAGFHEPNFPDHGGSFIDEYSARMTPPAVSACTPGGDCTPFWHSRPIEGHRLIAPQHLELMAADKTTRIYGTILLPAGHTAPHSIPLIVNPYGGPDVGTTRDAWSGRSFLFDQLLAEHGFAVLHVDNRGMGGRGRDFEQACYHNFGPPQFADQMASIDQVLRRYPQLDPRRLGWWGWSWGGSFTLFALSHSNSFLAGVSVAPVADWRDYDSIYTERYMGLPSDDAQNYHDDSDVTSASSLHGRILIMHGTGDDNVHLENSMQYIEKLIQARIPYDYNVFPRKTHAIAGPDDQTVLFEKIVAHFERYLAEPDRTNRATGEHRGHRR